ncbi:hypothetical protein [Bacillus kwashiorkori]|uniref:hypothetical protein n=1 Tax=Bacillus kwashiorkori TaxID=1522318 RepID=UPI000780ECC6|nr:hypothetical protein [Bacillus kwashiorkori]
MLAEIKGKISSTGTNLSERLEDQLTGNVFGTLRYLPFSLALGKIIAAGVYPSSVGDKFRQLHDGFWADKIAFWPYDREGELDALIELDNTIIGIEVKYRSGLSSDDDVSNRELHDSKETEWSLQQLARESRILSRKGGGRKHKILLFIADRKSCKEVYFNTVERNILASDVELCYLSWQDFLLQLRNIEATDPYHQVVVNDLVTLLIRKGFEDFTDMSVTVPRQIHSEEFFTFDWKDTSYTVEEKKIDVNSEVEIHFNIHLPINKERYYEFS